MGRLRDWIDTIRGGLAPAAVRNELALAKERLELTQTATGLTSWEWDLVKDEMTWTAGRPNLVRLGDKPSLSYRDVVANVHPDDREATLAAAYAAVENDTLFQAEFRVPVPDGTVRWIFSRGKVFRDAAGKPQRMLGVNLDITDRKVLEGSMIAEKERFRAIFEQTAVGVGYVVLKQKFHLANRKLCEMFGYSHGEITEKTVLDLIHPDDRAPAAATRDRLMASGAIIGSGEHRFVRRDGSVFWGELSASRVLLESATPILVIIIKDISERIAAEEVAKRALEELKAATRVADAANLAKTHFVANMSHEIRTPLTSILGFSDLLQQPGVTDEQRRKFIATILRNGQSLTQLINDILDLSKIEANRLVVVRSPVLIRPLLAHLRSTLTGLAAARQIRLEFHCDDAVPDVVSSDGAKLEQLLTNVLGNAIKFTHEGRVTLDVRLEAGHGTTGARLVFTITDTGLGMTKDQQAHLFEPFFQGDASTTRAYGGTGLGLALARRLARLFGGDLALMSSSPGKGSRFVATIPIVLDDHPAAAEPSVEAPTLTDVMRRRLAGVRVLLVEDSIDSRDYLTQALELAGIEVDVAGTGQEAIEMAMAQEFALVFMDVQLPVMDGLEATRRLRQLGYRTPIVALTAHALGDERDRCFLAGCDAHVTKPIRPLDLVAVVDRIVQGHER